MYIDDQDNVAWYEAGSDTTDGDGVYDVEVESAGTYRVEFTDSRGVHFSEYNGDVTAPEDAPVTSIVTADVIAPLASTRMPSRERRSTPEDTSTASVIGNTVFSSSFKTRQSVGYDVHTHKRDFTLHSAGYSPVVSDGHRLYVAGYYTFYGLEELAGTDGSLVGF